MVFPNFSIAAVERDTGLSKDVLRVWERRYGFPQPERDVHGERGYPAAQVERLRLLKRLTDQGHRPGKLMAMAPEQLAQLAHPGAPQPRMEPSGTPDADLLAPFLELIRSHDAIGFNQAMQTQMARQGMQQFISSTVAPLAVQVGWLWERGSFKVFEEHLFTELTKRLLRQAIASLPARGVRPRVLLTTVPDEQHALGLLLVEAMLMQEGATCIPLGVQMPLQDIADAAAAHRADVVAVSFSVAFPRRLAAAQLHALRGLLQADMALWAGGAGVQRLAPIAGVTLGSTLADVLDALADWRAARR
jgi:methanogenic corrinoid protein MtbC1